MENKKFEELANNEEFLTKLADCENNQQIQKLFAGNGVELNEEEVAAFVKTVEENAADELGEDALDNVSGGWVHPAVYAAAMAGAIRVGMAVATRVARVRIRFIRRVHVHHR